MLRLVLVGLGQDLYVRNQTDEQIEQKFDKGKKNNKKNIALKFGGAIEGSLFLITFIQFVFANILNIFFFPVLV